MIDSLGGIGPYSYGEGQVPRSDIYKPEAGRAGGTVPVQTRSSESQECPCVRAGEEGCRSSVGGSASSLPPLVCSVLALSGWDVAAHTGDGDLLY